MRGPGILWVSKFNVRTTVFKEKYLSRYWLLNIAILWQKLFALVLTIDSSGIVQYTVQLMTALLTLYLRVCSGSQVEKRNAIWWIFCRWIRTNDTTT